ncbi:MAG: transcription antitermination factor NusB [Bacilli bacterium]
MTEYTRTAEREKTMQCLYQVFLNLENKVEFDATEVLLNQYGVQDIDDVPVFSKVVYSMALDNLDDIEALVSKYLRNWVFDRIDNVAKAILVEAISEGNYGHLSPRNVIISQSVTLAKNYLSDGQHKFINAISDKALEKYDFKQE